MFVVSGTGLGYIRYKNNGGKPMRRSIDDWDRQSEYQHHHQASGLL
jgi:hypothetical protein